MKIKISTPKKRVTWGFDPSTRILPSKKRYRRSQSKSDLKRIVFCGGE